MTISERVDGAWVPLSTRLDETGHLVTALVGMNLTQFTQVAMLPQGRFQAFLRATSEDRHRLLQQLFRTERFEQVERWLRDRTVGAAPRRARSTERTVDSLAHRVSETAGVPLPQGPDPGDTDPVGPDVADPVGWARPWHRDPSSRRRTGPRWPGRRPPRRRRGRPSRPRAPSPSTGPATPPRRAEHDGV